MFVLFSIFQQLYLLLDMINHAKEEDYDYEDRQKVGANWHCNFRSWIWQQKKGER